MIPKFFLVAASIAVMWLAVLFVGVYGPDIRNESRMGDSTAVPVVTVVALCALIGTAVVAWRGFRE